ncbi:5999_t:CDS:2, partial [Cetraspora pellucida]
NYDIELDDDMSLPGNIGNSEPSPDHISSVPSPDNQIGCYVSSPESFVSLLESSVFLPNNYTGLPVALYDNNGSYTMILPNNYAITYFDDFVRVSIPRIDRFSIDCFTLPCKILEKIGEDQYRLGCKFGIINASYFSGEFELLGTTTYPELDKILSNLISVREAARLQSVGMIS